MNILLLCDEYPPGRHGGIGTLVQNLARQLVKMQHSVVVAGFYNWGYGGDDEFEDEGVKVYRLRRKMDWAVFSNKSSLFVRASFKLLRAAGIFQWDIEKSLPAYHAFLRQLISKHNIDIVEMPDFNDYMQYCTRYIGFPKFDCPTIVKLNGTITYFLKEDGKKAPDHIYKMEKDLLFQASAIASASQYTADKTTLYFDYKKPVSILRNGIDTKLFKASAKKNPNEVVFSGSLVAKKGIYQLMKAWNLLIEKHPGAQLTIFGKGPVKKIKKLLNAGTENSVVFKGHTSHTELFDALAKASIAVFPSYSEVFALAPMEAMACGTAVIYSKLHSGPELIRDGIDGILIDPANVEEIADKIAYLLSHPVECSKLASTAVTRISSEFDIQKIAERHIPLYLSVIEAYRNNANN